MSEIGGPPSEDAMIQKLSLCLLLATFVLRLGLFHYLPHAVERLERCAKRQMAGVVHSKKRFVMTTVATSAPPKGRAVRHDGNGHRFHEVGTGRHAVSINVHSNGGDMSRTHGCMFSFTTNQTSESES